jgi:acyl-CoA thioester hydrolase
MVKTEIRVIYGDTDQMGVVYYANYLRFFEAGRNEYLRVRGAPYRDLERSHRLFLPVVEVQTSYKRPARYDDVLVVETRLAKTGRASARFEYRVLRGEELVATGHTVHACVDVDGNVQALPEDLVRVLQVGSETTRGA